MSLPEMGIITDPFDGPLLIARGKLTQGGASIRVIEEAEDGARYRMHPIGQSRWVPDRAHTKEIRVLLADLEPEMLLEIHAGKAIRPNGTGFFQYHQNPPRLERLTEETLRQRLAARTIAPPLADPRSDPSPLRRRIHRSTS